MSEEHDRLLSASDEILKKKDAVPLLDYELSIFMELINEDYMVVFAEGIGYENILRSLCTVFSSPKFLVLLLNVGEKTRNSLIKYLNTKQNVEIAPTVMNANVAINKRKRMYMSGGIMIGSSRIFINDILNDRMPIEFITGVIVCRADQIEKSASDAFVLKMFREKNKSGFIKAFSEKPVNLIGSMYKLEKILKALHLKKVMLYPRFHLSVSQCFDKHPVDVIELGIKPSSDMLVLQFAIMDLMKICLKELENYCSTNQMNKEDFVLENALTVGYDQFLRSKLEPSLNLLGSKVSDLLFNIKSLRSFFFKLYERDTISIYNYLLELRDRKVRNLDHLHSDKYNWMIMKEGETFFLQLKSMVKQVLTGSEKFSRIKSKKDVKKILNLLSLKYGTVFDVLCEIEEICHSPSAEKSLKVLIIVPNIFVARSIKLLTTDPVALFKEVIESISENNKRDLLLDDDLSAKKFKFSTEEREEIKERFQMPQSANYVVLSEDDALLEDKSFRDVLEEYSPEVVVMYTPELYLIRQLEHFKSSFPGKTLRVYFLLYRNSIEEQMYLTSLRIEKEAFESLIQKQPRLIASSSEIEVRISDSTQSRGTLYGLNDESETSFDTGSIIVVDVRELKSSLPYSLYEQGFELKAIGIEVGDYILTPNIAVERKSIQDLIESLNTGRVYYQLVSLTRCYSRPYLLIEFDPAKSSSISSMSDLSTTRSKKRISSFVRPSVSLNGGYNSFSAQSKLVLLLLHFPSLKLIWSPSPKISAQLFKQLKNSEPDPNVQDCIDKSGDLQENTESNLMLPLMMDLLTKIPGITHKTAFLLTKDPSISNLRELSQCSIDSLISILGNDSLLAQNIYDFLHHKF